MTAQFIEENAPVRTIVETSVDAALERLAADRVDAVASDYDMPGTNGLELLDALRADHPDLPFVPCTGKGSEEIASDAISRGVTDYLQKGQGIERYDLLVNRPTNAIDQAAAQRELRETVDQFRSLADTFAFALVTIDEDSVIRHATPTVERVFGYEKAELLGRPLTTVMPERFREPHREAVARYLREGVRHLEWEWIELPGVARRRPRGAPGHHVRRARAG